MRTQGRVLAACVAVGFVAGVGGIVFTALGELVAHYSLEGVAGYHPSGPASEVRFPWIPGLEASLTPWLLLIVPTVGGLISGWIVNRFAPEAEGHGTDAAIASYHEQGGYVRPRVPLVKLISSALTIGTGGSGGREGPIAQIGAGFGSVLGGLLGFKPAQRRILLAAGMGAGVAAIFRAPLAGTLFAAEIMYFSPEFEPEVILPTGLASVVSYCTFGVIAYLLGGIAEPWKPLFTTPDNLVFSNAWELVPYTILAILMAVMSMIYVRTFYGIHHLFKRIPLSKTYVPAIGAAMTGAAGLIIYYALGRHTSSLAVMSYGYGILQDVLRDETAFPAFLLIAIAFGKILTTSLTIGSGGSGGVFGPSMVIGGCAGGGFGVLMHKLWPAAAPHAASFVILGMAGFFSAAAKTPFSTLIIVSEMTGDYRLLLPALWVCTLSFLISDEEPLYQSQVASRSKSAAHRGDFVRDRIAGVEIRRFVNEGQHAPTLNPSDSVAEVAAQFDAATYSVLPVVTTEAQLLGIVVLDELHLALKGGSADSWLVAADLMRTNIQPLHLDDTLDVAMQLFMENDVLALPLVEGFDSKRLVGIVRRAEVARAYLSMLQGEPEPNASRELN